MEVTVDEMVENDEDIFPQARYSILTRLAGKKHSLLRNQMSNLENRFSDTRTLSLVQTKKFPLTSFLACVDNEQVLTNVS